MATWRRFRLLNRPNLVLRNSDYTDSGWSGVWRV